MTASIRMSILSSRASSNDQQPKHAGKIRPGIKVLTKEAQQNPTAVRLYEEGLAKQQKFSDIEKLIKEKTALPHPMYPRNTPYFSVAASDFGMPEIARMIVQKYGEMRDGDTKAHLYRFPVVFHSDDLNVVYPNQFKRHGGDPSYESHYGEDGVRYCRYLPELSEQQKEENKVRRIKRLPRREKVVRGRCEPGVCMEFQQGQCKFKGRLMFYIPGIPTTGLLAMETSSEYAAEGIWTDLQRILDALGTIPRMNPSKANAPVFYITKVLEQRTYFDVHGQKQVGLQWVPKLQADIDVGQLLQSGRTIALPAPSTPVAWLASPKGMPGAALLASAQEVIDQASAAQAKPGGEVIDPTEKLAQMIEDLGVDEPTAMRYFDIKIAPGWEDNPDQVARALEMMVSMDRIGGLCAARLMSVTLKVVDLHLDLQGFNSYVFAKHGRGFTHKESVLATIEAEVDDWAQQPREQVITKIADALSPA